MNGELMNGEFRKQIQLCLREVPSVYRDPHVSLTKSLLYKIERDIHGNFAEHTCQRAQRTDDSVRTKFPPKTQPYRFMLSKVDICLIN